MNKFLSFETGHVYDNDGDGRYIFREWDKAPKETKSTLDSSGLASRYSLSSLSTTVQYIPYDATDTRNAKNGTNSRNSIIQMPKRLLPASGLVHEHILNQ